MSEFPVRPTAVWTERVRVSRPTHGCMDGACPSSRPYRLPKLRSVQVSLSIQTLYGRGLRSSPLFVQSLDERDQKRGAAALPHATHAANCFASSLSPTSAQRKPGNSKHSNENSNASVKPSSSVLSSQTLCPQQLPLHSASTHPIYQARRATQWGTCPGVRRATARIQLRHSREPPIPSNFGITSSCCPGSSCW